jgi:hypothetical protein
MPVFDIVYPDSVAFVFLMTSLAFAVFILFLLWACMLAKCQAMKETRRVVFEITNDQVAWMLNANYIDFERRNIIEQV